MAVTLSTCWTESSGRPCCVASRQRPATCYLCDTETSRREALGARFVKSRPQSTICIVSRPWPASCMPQKKLNEINISFNGTLISFIIAIIIAIYTRYTKGNSKWDISLVMLHRRTVQHEAKSKAKATKYDEAGTSQTMPRGLNRFHSVTTRIIGRMSTIPSA